MPTTSGFGQFEGKNQELHPTLLQRAPTTDLSLLFSLPLYILTRSWDGKWGSRFESAFSGKGCRSPIQCLCCYAKYLVLWFLRDSIKYTCLLCSSPLLNSQSRVWACAETPWDTSLGNSELITFLLFLVSISHVRFFQWWITMIIDQPKSTGSVEKVFIQI